MAFSTQRAVSNGTLQLLMIEIEFFDKSEITAYFNNTPTTAFVWATDKSIRFNSPVPNGVEVLIRRTTDLSQPRHIFSQGAQFKDSTLDEDFKQILHIAQEAVEGANVGDIYQTLNMHGNIIANVGNAVADGDAMNLGQVKAWSQSALNQADRATTEANRAQAQANSATASAGAAASSATTATGARDTTLTYRDDSQNARDLAREWASRAVDSQIPGYAGSYSALHHAVKAAASAVTAKNEADRGVVLAAAAESSANRAKTEADRAKTEADKLGNMNALAGALDSVAGCNVVWKGTQWATGYRAVNNGDADYQFANTDGSNRVRLVRNASGDLLLADANRGIIRYNSDTGGNFTTAGNVFSNKELHSLGGVIVSKAPSSPANAHIFLLSSDGTRRAIMYAASDRSLHIGAGETNEAAVFHPNGDSEFKRNLVMNRAYMDEGGNIYNADYDGGTLKDAFARMKPFDTGFVDVSASTSHPFTHGLYKAPVRYAIQLQCKVSEMGYAVGDIVNCPVGLDYAGGGLAYGIEVRQYDATSFNIFCGQSLRAYAINKGNTAVGGLSAGNWKVRVLAYPT